MKNFKSNASIDPLNLEMLVDLVASTNPKVVLEIGTHRGGSADVFSRYLNPEILITIDSGEKPEGTIIIDGVYYLWNSKSQDMKTFDKVINIIEHRQIDFLFIDGGHLINEVTQDYELYSPLVREGGLIGFDDVLFYEEGRRESPALWETLKRGHFHVQMHLGPSSTGLGLMRK